MKTLLIYMADNMQSHELSVHLQKCTPHASQEDFDVAIDSYRRHFNKKATAKVLFSILDVDDVTGVTVQIYNEMLTHPIKEKIIINNPLRPYSKPGMGLVAGSQLNWADAQLGTAS